MIGATTPRTHASSLNLYGVVVLIILAVMGGFAVGVVLGIFLARSLAGAAQQETSFVFPIGPRTCPLPGPGPFVAAGRGCLPDSIPAPAAALVNAPQVSLRLRTVTAAGRGGPPSPAPAALLRGRAAAARQPHKLEVAGSTPAPAIASRDTLVTAYCPCRRCCGVWADAPAARRRLASGRRLHPLLEAGFRFCAAPPEIPFGTMIDIPGYGTVPVLDRGGAIRGDRLDVFFPSHARAVQWGRRWLICRFKSSERK